MNEEFPVIYANLVQIAHGALEFLVDFKRVGPESPEPQQAQTLVRIVLHPVIAKAFLEALRENIGKYENAFGSIPGQPPPGPRAVH